MFTFQVFRANNGQWAWHLRAANNRIIAASGETYHNKQDAYHGIQLVKTHALLTQVREMA